MGGEWPEVSVEQIAAPVRNAIVGGPFGSNLVSRDYVDNGVPVIRGQNMGGRWIGGKFAYVTEEKALSLSANLAYPGDIVFTQRGTLGQVSLVPKGKYEYYLLSQSQMKVRVDPETCSAKFYYYVFSSEHQQNYIRQNAIQTGVPHTNLGILRATPVPQPTLSEQEKIGDLLSAFDDKIELNRQTNQTLESIAQALFKSWFVDFDPVIDNALAAGNDIPEPLAAKAAARRALREQGTDKANQPHTLPDHIRQLFPSRFQFTEELGWIPEGWGVSTIGDEVDTCGGGTPSTKIDAYWSDGVHAFCTPKDMSKLSGIVLMDTERKLTDEGLARISSGLLPTGTVLMSSRAPIGYLAVNDIPVSVNQGIIALLPHQSFNPLYLLLWAKSNLQEIEDRANGSTFQEISKKNFRAIPMVVPGTKLLSEFGAIASALRTKMEACEKQISVLTRLRDELLPKLLSGELRIPEAEKELDEALA